MRAFRRPHRNRRLTPFAPWPAILLVILASALATVNPRLTAAQASFAPGGQAGSPFRGTLFADQPTLFGDDGRIRLLVLGLNPFGLTESATEQIGLIMQKNLINTGHFDVVGPREINAAFEKSQPDLVDCREIACGVESGKRLGADFVLVGSLQLVDPVFRLQVRLIDTSNNLTDYEEEIRFGDEIMSESLFQLANNVSRNSLLRGRVLSTSIRGIVISLGKVHGIRIGDHMVIYKQEVPITSLEGQQIDTQRKNVAIVNVLNVNENSSEAILIHKTEEPQVGQFAHTYLDPQRQITLIEDTRRELDTGIRLTNRIRPLELAPVLVTDTERKRWLAALAEAEKDRKFWFTAGLIAGGATLWVLNDFDSNDNTDRLQLIVAGGAAGYAFYKWSKAREQINELSTEGRSKGWVGMEVNPLLSPKSVGIELAWRF